jgi:epoxyqueuosine reductase
VIFSPGFYPQRNKDQTMSRETEIREKARQLGYEDCAMIPVEEMEGYGQRLEERMSIFPQTRPDLQIFAHYAFPRQNNPWANSIIVCVRRYGKYRLPPSLQGYIGKYYQMDSRREPSWQDHRDSREFSQFLTELGLRAETEIKFGNVALRWAAARAGLGLVRRNNFFYTASGSWVYPETWLVDAKMELKAEPSLPPCPPQCQSCIKACPTGALSAPFTMNRSACITCITAFAGWDLINEPHRQAMGTWFYGCDACQDACPFNKKSWTQEEDFPQLAELAVRITPEKIIAMDYARLMSDIQPRFWYISRKKLWRFKTAALNVMLNRFRPEYLPAIIKARNDENEQVRHMAGWVLEQLENS